MRKLAEALRKFNRTHAMRLMDAFFASFLMIAVALSGLMDDMDRRISDWLYQDPGNKSQDIVVIGIDAATLEKLGPLPAWARRDMARAIRQLNQDPETRPAVIGVDIMFTGSNPYSSDWDQALADAAGEYGNVVVASRADVNEDKDLEAKKQDACYPWNRPWPWEPPYRALAATADTGHINAPNEPDNIVRHALLYVDLEERGKLYSFGRIIYEKWCKTQGIEPNPQPETGENGLYYLPFTAETYDSGFGFADLLEGKVSPEVYRGKIVLIGPYTPGMKDIFPTAMDHTGLMYGIDIHANIIEAFRKGFFPREVGTTQQLLLLFLIVFFSELFFRKGKMKHVMAWGLTVCIGWIALCWICYAKGSMLHAAWVPLTVGFLFVGAVYVHVREEEVRIASTFGRYFAPVVMRQLLAGNPEVFKLGGKLQDIAVLFVDIRGFTTMSENIPAPMVVEILNRYLTLTTKCIHKHHGTLDKFIGDCTMAFWNAPLEQKEPVLLACRAAMDMLAGSEKLCEEIKEQFGCGVSFGIGIHWGSAVVGNIGTSDRMDYTAIGDTVNTAARLEANAKGGQILISRAVAECLGAHAEVGELGRNITLKGKTKGFEILELKSLK